MEISRQNSGEGVEQSSEVFGQLGAVLESARLGVAFDANHSPTMEKTRMLVFTSGHLSIIRYDYYRYKKEPLQRMVGKDVHQKEGFEG